jgi:hypothetical protein
MYTRVTKEQFEIHDGVYTHIPTGAEFAPNTGCKWSRLDCPKDYQSESRPTAIVPTRASITPVPLLSALGVSCRELGRGILRNHIG